MMKQALERLEDDYEVELMTAVNGLDALAIIKEEQPGLVFLDVMIPQLSGLDVCKAVKKDWNMDNIYIVMLTAKGQEYERQNGLSVGADLYMTKPFRPREVLAKSLEVLGLT
jgi:DNA-binding response OmpR family regulator